MLKVKTHEKDGTSLKTSNLLVCLIDEDLECEKESRWAGRIRGLKKFGKGTEVQKR